MRRPTPNFEEEDATPLGGWLFADSFLALMIIFLATISFIPSIGGSISSAGSIGNLAGNSYVQGLNLVYQDFNPTEIERDIATFALQENISTGSSVLYVKIIGGFNPAVEDEDQGRFRALLFSAKLKTSELSRFSDAKIDLGASRLLKPDQIALRITLG